MPTSAGALAGDMALDKLQAIDAAIARCLDLARTFAIPPMREFGMSDADVMPMVELARQDSSMNFNPVTLSPEKLADVLRAAIGV